MCWAYLKKHFCSYIRHRSNYFRDRGIGGPPSLFLVGNLRDIFLNSGPLVLCDWTKKYGKTYGVMEGGIPVLITSDVEVLNDVFNKKFDYFHGRKVHKNRQG